MAIQELVHIIPPPDRPQEVGSANEWHKVGESIGIEYPPDLYELCKHYGSGSFVNIEIYNPFSLDYASSIEQVLAGFRFARQELGATAIPFPLFPEKMGLFPAGGNDNGGKLFWLTDGLPEKWALLLEDHPFQWQRFDMALTRFLTGLLKKEFECIWWDRQWLNQNYPTLGFRPRGTARSSTDKR